MNSLQIKIFYAGIESEGLPVPVAELEFSSNRKFRFDFAFPSHKLAIEFEGGVWIEGAHNRGKGFVKDMEKYNLACVHGWRLLRFQPIEVRKSKTYETIKQALNFNN